jgi:flavin-binding protein dodecin
MEGSGRRRCDGSSAIEADRPGSASLFLPLDAAGTPMALPRPKLALPGRALGLRTHFPEEAIAMGVIIIREMVGTSPRSWSDAARQAVATASKTVRNIRTIEVVKSTAEVSGGEIVEYRVDLKIGFEYEG